MTDGAFSGDGTFHSVETWDGEVVMKLFRERLLTHLTLRQAISEELVGKLLAWRHPGFSDQSASEELPEAAGLLVSTE